MRQPHPAIIREFNLAFIHALREHRFTPIVLEGCRISHPHIFEAFRSALFNAYGEYCMLRCFHLAPPVEVRSKQYMLRQAQLAKRAARDKDPHALAQLRHEYQKGFCDHQEPLLPGFEVVEDATAILSQAAALHETTHPLLPERFRDVLAFIAESGTYNPFYQRVEIDDVVLIHGFTESEKSWDNILQFGIDFRGLRCCDIGCMHGYYTFKLEEHGALPLGIDIDPGAIAAAQRIAQARHSSARFAVHNSEHGFAEQFDIILALNVLHRVGDFEQVCRNIFTSTSATILEIGERQIKELLTLAKPHGFSMKKALKSHRSSDVVGQRMLLHLVKR